MSSITKQLSNGNLAVIKDDGTHLELDPQGNIVGGDAEEAKGNSNRSLWGKAYDALAIPEKMSRQGLTQLTDTLTPSRQDIESGKVGIPGIAARTAGETLAEVAPTFVSRGALLTSGALGAAKLAAPVVGAIGKGIGNAAEDISGLSYKSPGALSKVFNDPSIILGKGKQAASKLYQQNLDPENVLNFFKEIPDKRDWVNTAFHLAKRGYLSPEEALQARKIMDEIGYEGPSAFPRTTYDNMRSMFDGIAKVKTAAADAAYSRGVTADALRGIWPTNKGGGPALFREAVLSHIVPWGGVGASPVIQGMTAAGLGTAAKVARPFIQDPSIGLAIPALMRKYNGEDQ